MKEIIEDCHAQAKKLISEHRFVLDECAHQLLIKEKLNRTEFEAIFDEEEKAKAASAEGQVSD